MALNQNSIADSDTTYSDWIEIYNPTSEVVYMQNYALTDDEMLPQKWVFPDVSLQPGAFLLVFASGKDTVYNGDEIHTNFKLDGDGEYLALITEEGTAVTEFLPMFPDQEVDRSYGYYNGGYIQFENATPREANTATASTILPKPDFNYEHGFYESPFYLEITSTVSSTTIYYTTDGSTPDENSTQYTGPINITTTTPVRAIATKSGLTSSKVTTTTFLFLDDVVHQSNTPNGYPAEWGPYVELSGNAIADYEMDPELVSDTSFAAEVKQALKELPTISIVTDKDNLFSSTIDENTGGIYIYTGWPIGTTTFGTGRGWERPVSVEYFDGFDTTSLQVDCGIRLQGGHGRRAEKSPKHSFLLLFKSEYGPSRLKYPLLGANANNNFNTITLRAGFGNSWIHHSHEERSRAQYQRDIWGKDTQREMGYAASHSIYAHLYINGLYWGIYAPSERMDDEFGGAYFEGKADDFDVIKDYAELNDGVKDSWDSLIYQVKQGMADQKNYMKLQGKNEDGTSNANYQNLLDLDEFIDYMLINYYAGNSDWDHHNWAAMRNRNNPETGFKFLVWDAEHMVKGVNDNVLGLNNSECPSNIFTRLRENEDFKRLVADHILMRCYNGGELTPEKAAARWAERASQIENAIVAESARWGDYRRDVHQYQTVGPFELYTKEDHWVLQNEYMMNTYFPQRTDVFLSLLRNENLYPYIDAPTVLLNDSFVYKSIITAGDKVTMSTPQGTIYYTTDGTDPVIWSTTQSTDIKKKTLIAGSMDKKVLVPTSDIGTNWYTDSDFDDSSWDDCKGSPGGVGYERSSGYDSYISLDVEDKMYNGGTSCYIRIPFDVTSDDLESYTAMEISARYDDGFVVYLNGTKVLEINSPSNPAWDASASSGNESGSFEEFNISSYFNKLTEGKNVLAIHALNLNSTSSDFIFNAQLEVSNRPSSGTASEEALLYENEISLDKSCNIKARAYFNGQWSAMTSNIFTLPDNFENLRITEIHYHPLRTDSTGEGKFEFIELKNVGDATINLEGVEFIAGIDYKFEKETSLAPGQFIVLASSIKNFGFRYGFYPYDDYKGQLDNNGETIKVINPLKDTIIVLRYEQDGAWPTSADGDGYSLVPTEFNPETNSSNGEDWKASVQTNGSPGRDDYKVEIPVQITHEVQEIGVELSQNYPNPFSGITYIDYSISEPAYVNISVYNIVGQHLVTLVDGEQLDGLHQVSWDGSILSPGIYIYTIQIKNGNNNKTITKKMLITK